MIISSIEDGKYIEVNENFVHITGYSREESIGTTSVGLGLFSEQDRDELKQGIIKNGRIDGMELTFHKKNGDTLHCLYFGEIITIDGEQRFLSTASDITECRKSEQDLRQAVEELLEEHNQRKILSNRLIDLLEKDRRQIAM